MRKIALVCFLIITNVISAQKMTKIQLLNKVANEICEDLKKDGSEVTEMKLGLKLFAAVRNNLEEVQYYFGEDIVTNKEKISEFSETIGDYLATICPEIMEGFYRSELAQYSDFSTFEIEGELSEIQRNKLLICIVKEDSGKKRDFLLLSEFDSAFLLTDNVLKKGDRIRVVYYELEIYDATIGRFVKQNVIYHLEKI